MVVFALFIFVTLIRRFTYFMCLPFYFFNWSIICYLFFFFFFFNDTATTEIYTLSLHDALPISINSGKPFQFTRPPASGNFDALRSTEHEMDEVLGFGSYLPGTGDLRPQDLFSWRSEEHTSELQSPCNLVCRLLLEKKKPAASASAGSSTRAHTSCPAFSAITAAPCDPPAADPRPPPSTDAAITATTSYRRIAHRAA